ncbi:MAG: hypothetical protein OJF47_003804 [Nitrospira sp.]|nr:MAG: hypothetical protein OJF47_003804 [Nitrospira sp.]
MVSIQRMGRIQTDTGRIESDTVGGSDHLMNFYMATLHTRIFAGG